MSSDVPSRSRTSGSADGRPASDNPPAQRVAAALRQVTRYAAEPPAFDPDAAPASPLDLFAEWFDCAVDARVPEPRAMTLSTSASDVLAALNGPDARMVILTGLSASGAFTFASESNSAKAAQLAAHPAAALTFFWGEQSRSVRVRGRVTLLDDGQVRKDFERRSPQARAIALHGRQSDAFASVVDRDRALGGASRAHTSGGFPTAESDPTADTDPTAASDAALTVWRVWAVLPDSVEFWQSSPDQRHLRLVYSAQTNVDEAAEGTPHTRSWTRSILGP